MLGAAVAVTVAAIAAAPAPAKLVLRPGDVPAGYARDAAASGATAPNAYRAAFADAGTRRLTSVAVVFASAPGAAAQVAVPAAGCGRGATRRIALATPLGDHAVVCAASAKGYDSYAVVWSDGRVFATVALAGRHGEVSARLAVSLARAQERRILRARAAGPVA